MTARTIRVATLTPILAGLLVAACSSSSSTPRRVRVLFTTDEHSHLLALAPELDDRVPALGTGALAGGVLRRATVLSAQRAQGVETVTVSAGDWSQGTLASAAFAVANFDLSIMKRLGYDAVGIGNHEFDLGPRGLALAIQAAEGRDGLPPLVLSNVRFSGTAADAPLAALWGPLGSGKQVAASRVVTLPSGARVGVVAAMGRSAAFDCSPSAAPVTFTEGIVPEPANHVAALQFIAAAVQAQVTLLRQTEKVDLVILLGHGGVGRTASELGDDEQLGQLLAGVDLVVSGHTHRRPDVVRTVTGQDQLPVPVMQAAPFGAEVGQAEFVLEGGRARLDTDPTRTRFIPVDDRTAASTDPALVAELGGMVAALEARRGASPSFLEATLSAVESAAAGHAVEVRDDAAVVGDLFFRSVGHTTFDVVGLAPGETNGLNLDTDAILALARALGGPTTVALQASGSIRGDLPRGKTGQLAFADVFRVVPLGVDPADGTPGYPLVRFHLLAAELRGALELTLGLAMSDGDFYVSPAGLAIAYDATRTPFSTRNPTGSGWITRLAAVADDGTETPLYDLAGPTGGWLVNPVTTLLAVASTYQLAAFAETFGVTPRAADGAQVSIASTVLHWPGTSRAVKNHEALAAYIRRASTPTGDLPAVYDAGSAAGHVPRRIVCSGLACP
jgi:2',3'-cyclic-nucleotide 2'-phosphodiesterase (5'-nucleotidase family)